MSSESGTTSTTTSSASSAAAGASAAGSNSETAPSKSSSNSSDSSVDLERLVKFNRAAHGSDAESGDRRAGVEVHVNIGAMVVPTSELKRSCGRRINSAVVSSDDTDVYERRPKLCCPKFTLKAGTMTMLMGPASCGKTVLLDTLAGRLPSSLSLVTEHGEAYAAGTGIFLNGVEMPLGEHAGYALQEDVLNALTSPRENLSFLARLQLPRTMTAAERVERVEAVLTTLGIAHVGDTKVGTPGLDRGLSGGERKRAAIAQALIKQPPVLLVDDPTAGLDAAIAISVIDTLGALATETGTTILASVAQASAEMLTRFDQVICMSGGFIVYAGPPKSMLPYFCPDREAAKGVLNPADFVLDLLSREPVDESGAASASDTPTSRLRDMHQRWVGSYESPSPAPKSRSDPTVDLSFAEGSDAARARWPVVVAKLTQRQFVLALRNAKAMVARAMQALTTSLLYGILYWQMSLNQTSWRDRLGLFFLVAIFNLFSGMQGSSTIFLTNLGVYRRESAEKLYGPLQYLLANVMADLPIQVVLSLGFAVPVFFMSGLVVSATKFFLFALICFLCGFIGSTIGLTLAALTRDAEATNALAPAVFIPSVLLSGYLLRIESITIVLRWLRHVSIMKYAFLTLVLSEFEDLTFYCSPSEAVDGVCPFPNGQRIIADIDARRDGGIGFNVGILFAILGGIMFFALAGLFGARRK